MTASSHELVDQTVRTFLASSETISISAITIADDEAIIILNVPSEKAPGLEELRLSLQNAVAALPQIRQAKVILTAARAPFTGEKTTGSDKQKIFSPRPLANIRSIIAIASGKGGVGKSTTAVNLALALSKSGLRVGLLDADIYGPSIPRLLGISEHRPESLDGKVMIPVSVHGIVCNSIGFLIDEESPIIWRAPMVVGALEQLLRETLWGELDILVIDMPPGTGDIHLSLCQKLPLSGAVIVSTPQDIALIDARRGLNMFRKVNVPVLGFIENMSYFICPNCGHEAHIFGHDGAREEAHRLQTEFLGAIPLDSVIRITSDDGVPIVSALPDSAYAIAYRTLAGRIREQLNFSSRQ